MSYEKRIQIEDQRGHTASIGQNGSMFVEVTGMPTVTTVDGSVSISSGSVDVIQPESATPVVSSFSIGTTSTELVAASADNKYIEIFNLSSSTLYINIGADATSSSFPVPGNTGWWPKIAGFAFTSKITGIFESGSGHDVRVIVGT